LPGPVKDLALGAVDGANKDFTTPTPYVDGSLRVFVNGQLVSGFAEGAGDAFQMEFAPVSEDEIAVYYMESL